MKRLVVCLNYIIRRLLYVFPLLLGVTFITFVLFNVVGGDPCLVQLGKHVSNEQLEQCHANLGLDKPLVTQFAYYLKQVITLDFGRSFTTKQKISEIILDGIGPSMSVAVPTFILITLLAIAIALMVSFYRGRLIDRLGVFMCIVGMSVTVLAYIIIGQNFFAYKMRWFPIFGMGTQAPI